MFGEHDFPSQRMYGRKWQKPFEAQLLQTFDMTFPLALTVLPIESQMPCVSGV